MKRESKRFTTSKWVERLIPVILAILTLVLVATIALVLLSALGVLHF